MQKLLVLTLNGNFTTGFDVRWEFGPDGKIPYHKGLSRLALLPCPDLKPALQAWQRIYHQLDGSRITPIPNTITNVQYADLRSTCQLTADTLERVVNEWFDSSPLSRMIHQDLLTNPEDEYRVIIGTEDPLLREIPWLLWKGWNQFKHLEISLGTPYNKRRPDRIYQQQVRVLVILGNSDGIDIETDLKLLRSYCQDADVEYLHQPSIEELRRHLSDERGWDIVFFSGHSRSESANKGRIYLNATDSLTMEDLRKELKIAIEKGLQLAIFNSCDGIGIAVELEILHIPQVIIMREPVPDPVAQDFLKYFLAEFTSGRSLYQSVRIARRKLTELESNFPCASWLPTILQNCLEIPPTWQSLGSIPQCPYLSLPGFTEEEQAASSSSLTPMTRPPMTRPELIDSLVNPAHELNVQFQEGIIETILDSGFTKGYSLPLIESVLAKLWAKQQEGYLTHRAYKDIGGIERFLADRAEKFYDSLTPDRQKQIGSIFIQLVRIDRNNILYPHKAKRIEIGDDNWSLINDLAAKCLVVIDRDNETVELIHKSLIHWNFLSEQMKIDGNFRRWQESLKDPITQWLKSDRQDLNLLLRGNALNKAKEHLNDYYSQISQPEKDFISRSLNEQKKNEKSKKRFQKLLIASLIAIIAIICFLWFQSVRAKQDSVINNVRASTKNAELLFKNGNQLDALKQARQAAKLSSDNNLDSISTLPAMLTLQDILFRIQEQEILSETATEIIHSQNGEIVSFVDLNNKLNLSTYDTRSGKYLNKIYQQNDMSCSNNNSLCTKIIGNNGRVLITANQSSITLWKINSSSSKLEKLNSINLGKNITALAIDSTSRKLAVSLEGSIILLYSIDEENKILSETNKILDINDYIEIIKFSPDSQKIIIGTKNGVVKILDTRDLKVTLLDPKVKSLELSALDLSADGNKIVVGYKSGKITLWDVQQKQILDVNDNTTLKITDLNFSPDNSSIAASDDREIKIWRIDNNKLALSEPLIENNDSIDSINFSPNGKNIILGSEQGSVKSWQLNSSNNNSIIPRKNDDKLKFDCENREEVLPKNFPDISNTQSCSFNPVTDTIATSIKNTSKDSKSRVIFRSHSGRELSDINRHWDKIPGISSLSFSYDGKVLLTGNETGQLQLWDLKGKLLKTVDTGNRKIEITKVKFGLNDQEIIAIDLDNENKIYYNLNFENLDKRASALLRSPYSLDPN